LSRAAEELRSTWSRRDVQYSLFLILPVLGATMLGYMYSVDPVDDHLWAGEYDKFGDDKDADLEPGEVALWAEQNHWKINVVVQGPEGETLMNLSTANVTESISVSVNGQDRIYLKMGSFEVEEQATFTIYANNTANLYITKNVTQGGFLSFMCLGGVIGLCISVMAYLLLFKKGKLPPE
jgi:hypothetical protein